jgi:hypothetical protein
MILIAPQEFTLEAVQQCLHNGGLSEKECFKVVDALYLTHNEDGWMYVVRIEGKLTPRLVAINFDVASLGFIGLLQD